MDPNRNLPYFPPPPGQLGVPPPLPPRSPSVAAVAPPSFNTNLPYQQTQHPQAPQSFGYQPAGHYTHTAATPYSTQPSPTIPSSYAPHSSYQPGVPLHNVPPHASFPSNEHYATPGVPSYQAPVSTTPQTPNSSNNYMQQTASFFSKPQKVLGSYQDIKSKARAKLSQYLTQPSSHPGQPSHYQPHNGQTHAANSATSPVVSPVNASQEATQHYAQPSQYQYHNPGTTPPVTGSVPIPQPYYDPNLTAYGQNPQHHPVPLTAQHGQPAFHPPGYNNSAPGLQNAAALNYYPAVSSPNPPVQYHQSYTPSTVPPDQAPFVASPGSPTPPTIAQQPTVAHFSQVQQSQPSYAHQTGTENSPASLVSYAIPSQQGADLSHLSHVQQNQQSYEHQNSTENFPGPSISYATPSQQDFTSGHFSPVQQSQQGHEPQNGTGNSPTTPNSYTVPNQQENAQSTSSQVQQNQQSYGQQSGTGNLPTPPISYTIPSQQEVAQGHLPQVQQSPQGQQGYGQQTGTENYPAPPISYTVPNQPEVALGHFSPVQQSQQDHEPQNGTENSPATPVSYIVPNQQGLVPGTPSQVHQSQQNYGQQNGTENFPAPPVSYAIPSQQGIAPSHPPQVQQSQQAQQGYGQQVGADNFPAHPNSYSMPSQQVALGTFSQVQQNQQSYGQQNGAENFPARPNSYTVPNQQEAAQSTSSQTQQNQQGHEPQNGTQNFPAPHTVANQQEVVLGTSSQAQQNQQSYGQQYGTVNFPAPPSSYAAPSQPEVAQGPPMDAVPPVPPSETRPPIAEVATASVYYPPPPPPPAAVEARADGQWGNQPGGPWSSGPHLAGSSQPAAIHPQPANVYHAPPPPPPPQLPAPSDAVPDGSSAPRQGPPAQGMDQIAAHLGGMTLQDTAPPRAAPLGLEDEEFHEWARPIPRVSDDGAPNDAIWECPEQRELDYEADWYHLAEEAPDFLVCTRCHEMYLKGTQLAAALERVRRAAGRCRFNVPRVTRLLLPEYAKHGDDRPIRDFMSARLGVQDCKGPQGATGKAGIKWFKTLEGRLDGVVCCEACHEDVVLATPFRDRFVAHDGTQGPDSTWACDVCLPFVGRTLVKFGRRADGDPWEDWVQATVKHMNLPKCEKKPVSQTTRRWVQLRGGQRFPDLKICERCYEETMAYTPIGLEFELAAQATSHTGLDWMDQALGYRTSEPEHWNCGSALIPVYVSVAAAKTQRDIGVLLRALEVIMPAPACTAQGIVGGTWYTLAGGGCEEYNLCAACHAAYIRTWNLDRFYERRRVDDDGAAGDGARAVLCSFHPTAPRFSQHMYRMQEGVETGVWSRYAGFARRFDGVPECPRETQVGDRKWYGWDDCTICPECYVTFCKGSSPAPGVTMDYDGVVVAQTRMCCMYSPRMRQKWTEACRAGSGKELVEFSVVRHGVYRETVLQVRMMRDMQQMKMMMAMSAGFSSITYQGIESLKVISGTTDGYEHGNSALGWHATEEGATSAMYRNQMQEGMSQANSGSTWMMIAQLTQKWMEFE